MVILVTGAGGFLGSRLVKKLLHAGHEVIGVGRSPVSKDLQHCAKLSWIQRDLAREGLRPDELSSVDVVFHLAGGDLRKSIVTGGEAVDASDFFAANELTTFHVMQSCAGRAKTIVHASSQMVYGNIDHLSVNETFPLEGFESPYAVSKVNAENWVRLCQKAHGNVCIVLRFCGFIEGGGAVDYMIDSALNNKSIELFSGGLVCRDYLPVEKGLDALTAAASIQAKSGFHVFNIGSGQEVTTKELAYLVRDELGVGTEIILSDKPAPRSNFVYDITKARKMLSFDPGSLVAAVKAYARERRGLHAALR